MRSTKRAEPPTDTYADLGIVSKDVLDLDLIADTKSSALPMWMRRWRAIVDIRPNIGAG